MSWVKVFRRRVGAAMALMLLTAAPSQADHLEVAGSERVRITYDTTFTWPGRDGVAKMELPVPPETGAQHVESFDSSLHGRMETDAAGHRMLVATIHPNGERRVRWRVEMTVLLRNRQLVQGAGSGPLSGGGGAGDFLGTSESLDWKAADFQAWLDDAGLRRHADEAPVDFGRRVYGYLLHHGRYQYPPSSAWTSAACARRLRTDCGGFSLVFAGACRANGIPARLLVGQLFKARRTGSGVELTGGRQAHVIAEFYDPAIGWIPEDISSTFLHVPGFGDNDFFGRDPGYFFAWHTDTDFYFDTPRRANVHEQWIQNPGLWFSAEADGANDGLSHHWEIERL